MKNFVPVSLSIPAAVKKESIEYLRHQLSVKSFAAAGLEDLLFEESRTLVTYKLHPNYSLRSDDI